MNQIFNFQRFKNLILIFAKEKGSLFLLYLLLTTLALFLLMFAGEYSDLQYSKTRYFFWFLYAVVNAGVALNMERSTYRLKNRFSHFLLTPSSVTEKIVKTNAIVTVVLLCSTFVFLAFDYAYVEQWIPKFSFFNEAVRTYIDERSIVLKTASFFNDELLSILLFIYVLMNIEGIFLISKRHKLNILYRIGGFLGLLWFSSLMNYAFWGDNTKPSVYLSLGKVTLKNKWNGAYNARIGADYGSEYELLFHLPLLILIIAAYYYKLKEREV